MGQSASTPGNGGPRGSLPQQMRYAALQTPNNVTVHILGVYPCSTVSEEEAKGLVAAVQPAVLYVDVHPEVLSVLAEECAPGKAGSAPTELAPRYHKYDGAGWISSIKVRQLMADNEMFRLIGAEMFGAYRAGIAAAFASCPAPPTLLAFPMKLDYNNGENMERPSHVVATLIGNAQMNSDTVFATLGSHIRMLSGADVDITFPVSLPPTLYFTRAQVQALQDKFRATVNAVVRRSTSETADSESEAEALEAKARAGNDVQAANVLHDFTRRAQYQTQSIVYALHDAAAKLPPNSQMVALVNLGSLQSFKRNWHEGRPYEELFPPLSPVTQVAVYGVQTALLGGAAYGWYRLGRRFPKTTIGLTVLVGAAAGMTAYGMIYAETMMYGQAVRSALARPRVSSSVTRMNTK